MKIMTWKVITLLLAGFISFSLSAGEAREDIHAAPELVQPILPGMNAPAFEVRSVTGETVQFDSSDLQKPLVLTFFRGGWCPYCNLHLSEMRHAEEELLEIGFDVWFISIDKPELLAESLDQPDLAYTLLSDSKLQATRAFGIAFTLDEETYQRYLTYDIDIEEASGETHHVLPVPSTFIIGSDGVISFQYSNTNYKVRLHPGVLLAAARAHMKEVDKRLPLRRAEQRKGG